MLPLLGEVCWLWAQQLEIGPRRVCHAGRGEAEKTKDFSVTPVQSCNATWDFQPLFAWAAALESAHCTRNGLCFMHQLVLLKRGSECKLVKRPDCPAMFATG